MALKVGILGVSVSALGLAVASYFVQGAGAVSIPVEVADFQGPAVVISAETGGDEYEFQPDSSGLRHDTNSQSAAACLEGSGFGLIKQGDETAILCDDGRVVGYLVRDSSGQTSLIELSTQKENCSAPKREAHPDA
jgi:hypothetical protein